MHGFEFLQKKDIYVFIERLKDTFKQAAHYQLLKSQCNLQCTHLLIVYSPTSLVPRPWRGRPGTHCVRMRVIFVEIT